MSSISQNLRDGVKLPFDDTQVGTPNRDFSRADFTINFMVMYLEKIVGRDMVLKVVLGIFRLLAHHTTVISRKLIFQKAAMSVLDGRMLLNFGRSIFTLLSSIRLFRLVKQQPSLEKLLLVLSYIFRGIEQIFGDLGYLQKNIFFSWNRYYFTWSFKFWKSLSVTSFILSEILKIYQHLATECRAKTTNRLSSEVDCHLQEMRKNNLKDPFVVQGITQSNSLSSPRASELLALLLKDSSIYKSLKNDFLFVIRSICDAIVFYQWIPCYKLNKTFSYTCSIISGVLGVYLVALDTSEQVNSQINTS